MDVQSEEEEEEKTMTSTVSLPRFDLAETVVTAIGRLSSVVEPSNSTMADDDNHDDSHGMQYEYVTHVERNCDGSKLAAALSSREVKVYGRGDCTIRIEGTMTGHTGAITQIAFAPGDPRALLSSSQDGTVKGWDTRTLKESMNFGQSGEEIWSVAVSIRTHRPLELDVVQCFLGVNFFPRRFMDMPHSRHPRLREIMMKHFEHNARWSKA